MSVSIVWTNGKTARVYHFSEDRMERDVMDLRPGGPETYDILAGTLLNSQQILVLSPSDAGESFRRVLLVRFPDIHRRLVGCEVLDQADDASVAEYATKYFQKPHLKVN